MTTTGIPSGKEEQDEICYVRWVELQNKYRKTHPALVYAL